MYFQKPSWFAVWLVADFEEISYQVTTTFDASCAAQIRTAPAINYTACWLFSVFYPNNKFTLVPSPNSNIL